MSQSYFANAVWGVVLSDREQKKLNNLLREHMEEATTNSEGDADKCDLMEYILRQHAPELQMQLREKYGAPDVARILHTGDEESRPGECNIDAELWLLGIGYPNFPIRWPQRKKFKNARWYSWVTGDC